MTDDRERCRRPAFPEDRALRPAAVGPSRCWPAPLRLAVPAIMGHGDSVYGIIARCGGGWRPNHRPMSWRSRQGICGARHAARASGKHSWPAGPRRGGHGSVPATGPKGPRWYDWRWLPLVDPLEPGWHRWLLVRRSLSAPMELTAYVVFASHATPLQEVVRVAGAAGPSRAALRRPRAKSAWISMKCGAGRPGIGISPSRCGRWPWLIVMRAGTIAVEALKKSLPPPQVASHWRRFKAGVASPPVERAELRRLLWRLVLSCPKRSATSWPGRSGVGGTRASPNIYHYKRRDGTRRGRGA